MILEEKRFKKNKTHHTLYRDLNDGIPVE